MDGSGTVQIAAAVEALQQLQLQRSSWQALHNTTILPMQYYTQYRRALLESVGGSFAMPLPAKLLPHSSACRLHHCPEMAATADSVVAPV